MTNFILQKPGYVLKNERGFIICVIAHYNGHFFPFIQKNDHLVRADIGLKDYRKIADNHLYGRMIAQVEAIFKSNKIFFPKEVLSVNILHPTTHQIKKEKERLLTLGRYKIQLLTNGRIIINRTTKDNGERKIVHYPFDDIEKAIRSQNHVIEGYVGEEIGEIANNSEITGIIAEVNDGLLKWDKDNEESKPEIERKIKTALSLLEKVRNTYKLATVNQLDKMQEIKDILDRLNPSAMAARGASAKHEMHQRHEEILGIIAYNLAARNVLVQEKLEIESNILAAKVYLRALINSSVIWKRKEWVSTEIGKIIFHLQSAWANPYYRPAKDARIILLETKSNLYANETDLAKADLKAALAILK